jgi:integrase
MNIKSCFIRKRGQKYCVVVEYLDRNTGKIKQKTQQSFDNRKEADKCLIDVKYSINNNKFAKPTEMSLTDRCKIYIKGKELEHAAPNTIIGYNNTLKNHIEPFFEDMKLEDITPFTLQSYMNLKYNELNEGSAKYHVGFVKSVLKESYRLREVPENVCDFVKTPKILKENHEKSEINPYSKEEAQFLISKLEGHNLEIPLLLILSLGLRKTEATGLAWKYVDFENSKIYIEKSLYYKGVDGFELNQPKTKYSIRTLNMPDELALKLKREKIRQHKLKLKGLLKNELDLVCLNTKLKPHKPANVVKVFYVLCNSIGLRKVKVHDLRHTNATLLLLSGTDFKTISKRLGHKNVQFTINTYGHVLEEMDLNANKNISNILFK